jgi:hypothetical protein
MRGTSLRLTGLFIWAGQLIWIKDLRAWHRKRMFLRLLRRASEGTLTPKDREKLLNRSYDEKI